MFSEPVILVAARSRAQQCSVAEPMQAAIEECGIVMSPHHLFLNNLTIPIAVLLSFCLTNTCTILQARFHHRTSESISLCTMFEATIFFVNLFLQILKEWNPSWCPKIWMTDYSEAEFLALKQTFPDAKMYLCEFHREQCWERWVRDQKHKLGAEDAQILLMLLRKMAYASSGRSAQSACFIALFCTTR